MTGNPKTIFGVTWHRPTRVGVTWITGAMFALAALVATAVPMVGSPSTPSASNAEVALTAPGTVGTLQPSMVAFSDAQIEMLQLGGGEIEVLDLERLRRTTLRGWVAQSDGAGIDIALIDTGVAPVAGLDGANVLYGPDLSFEANSPEAANNDSYGHGTHMAGILVGNRADNTGMAPGARVVSVKVAGHDGITTVPQVVAAIDWVIDHKDSDGLNIRIINLSLGQQGVTNHVGDELSAAVERAWHAGLFVVVAAGNDGDTQTHLDSPAIDPYVVAVGAVDSTPRTQARWWQVPAWSAQGDGVRNPDLVAGGISVASYRVPGSTIDNAVPGAIYGDDLFRGSGTSQAAATVSGAAAVLLSIDPTMTNDDLKAAVKSTSYDLPEVTKAKSGEGLINAYRANMWGSSAAQSFPLAAGEGSGIIVPSGATWSGGTWSGATWSGGTWSGATWSGATWSGATWSGATWSGATWSGATWSGATWSGNGWVTGLTGVTGEFLEDATGSGFTHSSATALGRIPSHGNGNANGNGNGNGNAVPTADESLPTTDQAELNAPTAALVAPTTDSSVPTLSAS